MFLYGKRNELIIWITYILVFIYFHDKDYNNNQRKGTLIIF